MKRVWVEVLIAVTVAVALLGAAIYFGVPEPERDFQHRLVTTPRHP